MTSTDSRIHRIIASPFFTMLKRRFNTPTQAADDGSNSASAGSSAAAVAARCATLLRGGMHTSQVVAALARDAQPVDLEEHTSVVRTSQLGAITQRVQEGARIGDAFAEAEGPEWRLLGAAWNLAEMTGAPFAPVLDRIAAALRSIDELGRRRTVLLAAPRTTVRLVSALPIAAIAVGWILGFDPLPVFTTPFGVVLLCVGLSLQFIGARWAHRLTAKVEADDRVAGLECELMWVGLSGGAPPALARLRVADAVSQARAEWIELASLCRGTPLDRAMNEAIVAGVPASALLLDAATEERATTLAVLEEQAERLGVRILIPLATCILPAFIVLGVVPVVTTLLGDVVVF
ncbi:MAG: type II secretion system F family protein [Leucobacter sp.]